MYIKVPEMIKHDVYVSLQVKRGDEHQKVHDVQGKSANTRKARIFFTA